MYATYGKHAPGKLKAIRKARRREAFQLLKKRRKANEEARFTMMANWHPLYGFHRKSIDELDKEIQKDTEAIKSSLVTALALTGAVLVLKMIFTNDQGKKKGKKWKNKWKKRS